ncbi:MAG: GatB/YqeY domain-containing protein, partial [bacterium]|nr:GatB/YqeY domain-containing protein [bacterium]
MLEKLRAELMVSMKARDALKVSVLRGLIAAFTNEQVAKGKKPDEVIIDDDALTVIKRAVKQR